MKSPIAECKRRKFERIVILVDITVIFRQDDFLLTEAYIYNSVRRILENCNEINNRSTVWGYKLFDPCRNPLESRSAMGQCFGAIPLCEQFDATSSNLEKFGKMLHALFVSGRRYAVTGESRAEYIVRALKDVISDYLWDPLIVSDNSSSDEERGSPLAKLRGEGDETKSEANAVILFTRLPSTWEEVKLFLNSPELGHSDVDVRDGFTIVFQAVQSALKSRFIHVGWVDMPLKQDLWSPKRLEMLLSPTPERRFIEDGLSSMVRGFFALELLLICPTLVSFHLIWNRMTASCLQASVVVAGRVRCEGSRGEPIYLEQVEMQALSVCHKGTSLQVVDRLRKASGDVDISLDRVRTKSSFTVRVTALRFLVRTSSETTSLPGNDKEPVGDKLLLLTQQNPPTFHPGRPAWPLLLLTLAGQKSACEVSISDQDGFCCKAILEPVTAHSAILGVFEKDIMPVTKITEKVEQARSTPSSSVISKEPSMSAEGLKVKGRKDRGDIAIVVLPSRKKRRVIPDDGIRLEKLHDYYRGDQSGPEKLTWQEFWGRVQFEGQTFLPESGTLISRYIDGGSCSQLLQMMDSFLKTPYISNVASVNLPDREGVRNVSTEMDGYPSSDPLSDKCEGLAGVDEEVRRNIQSEQNSEALADLKPSQSSDTLAVPEAQLQSDKQVLPVAETGLCQSDVITVQLDSAGLITVENSRRKKEALKQKMLEYAWSVDTDNYRFANMLISEARSCLYVVESEAGVDEQVKRESSLELGELLLQSPKELLRTYENSAASQSTTSTCPSAAVKIKAHELQILLRLEILSSDGNGIGSLEQDKLVQDICNLLDGIQFHLDGGIFGGKSLFDYCNRVIAKRYEDSLPSVVRKIFSSMELDGYGEFSGPFTYLENLEVTGTGLLDEVDRQAGNLGISQQAKELGVVQVKEASGSKAKADVAGKPKGLHKSKSSKSRKRKEVNGSSGPSRFDLNDEESRGKKKSFYHFGAGSSNLHLVKGVRPHQNLKNTLAEKAAVCKVWKRVVQDNHVQMVSETPNFGKYRYLMCPGADDASQLFTCRESSKNDLERNERVVKCSPAVGDRPEISNVLRRATSTGKVTPCDLNNRIANTFSMSGSVHGCPVVCQSMEAELSLREHCEGPSVGRELTLAAGSPILRHAAANSMLLRPSVPLNCPSDPLQKGDENSVQSSSELLESSPVLPESARRTMAANSDHLGALLQQPSSEHGDSNFDIPNFEEGILGRAVEASKNPREMKRRKVKKPPADFLGSTFAQTPRRIEETKTCPKTSPDSVERMKTRAQSRSGALSPKNIDIEDLHLESPMTCTKSSLSLVERRKPPAQSLLQCPVSLYNIGTKVLTRTPTEIASSGRVFDKRITRSAARLVEDFVGHNSTQEYFISAQFK